MSIKRALVLGLTLVASTALVGCGSGDDSDGSGLPAASDMAAIAEYVGSYTSCQDLKPGDTYDTVHRGDNSSWLPEEGDDLSSWSVRERAVCSDASGDAITLLSVSDMKAFQSAAKKGNDKFLIGQDFAVVPVNGLAIEELRKSALRFLTCDPDFSVPSGYEKEPALVDGCVLSDYVTD